MYSPLNLNCIWQYFCFDAASFVFHLNGRLEIFTCIDRCCKSVDICLWILLLFNFTEYYFQIQWIHYSFIYSEWHKKKELVYNTPHWSDIDTIVQFSYSYSKFSITDKMKEKKQLSTNSMTYIKECCFVAVGLNFTFGCKSECRRGKEESER